MDQALNTKTVPKVSIVLPVYNAAKFLSRTLDSILKQDFWDFEIIAINDGSKDESALLLSRIRDPRITVIDNETNIGLIATLNKGLALARGEYVARCDADDLYHPQRLSLQMDYLKSHTDVGVLGTDAWFIDESDRVIGTTYNFPYASIEMDVRLLRGSPFFHSSVIYKKSLVEDAGGYPEGFVHAEDYALWLKLYPRTRYANLKKRLLMYRFHPSSISREYEEQMRESSERAVRTFLPNGGSPMDLDNKWGRDARLAKALLIEEIWQKRAKPYTAYGALSLRGLEVSFTLLTRVLHSFFSLTLERIAGCRMRKKY